MWWKIHYNEADVYETDSFCQIQTSGVVGEESTLMKYMQIFISGDVAEPVVADIPKPLVLQPEEFYNRAAEVNYDRTTEAT